MIAASIDIGTNSVLLLVAEIKNNSIIVLEELQSVPRLGKGVDKEKNLQPESQKRVFDVLTGYKFFLEECFPSTVRQTVVTATSAVRDAGNRDEFSKHVYQLTGWEIRLLSGDEEAQTTYKGALSVLEKRNSLNNLVIDIGGGSTELAFGSGNDLTNAFSIDIGSVRFTERFFKNNPPHDAEIKQLRKKTGMLLNNKLTAIQDFDLIGVAGTVTSIASIDAGLESYDVTVLNGNRLSRSTIQGFINQFGKITPGEIEKRYPAFLTGRGEVILAGILILDEIMNRFNKQEIIVSTGGIRHGILLEEK